MEMENVIKLECLKIAASFAGDFNTTIVNYNTLLALFTFINSTDTGDYFYKPNPQPLI